MTVEEALPWLKEHKEELLESIRNGSYKPSPVRRKDIPKPDGGTRQLGIPTVIDRDHPTSNRPNPHPHLRTTILRRKLWLPARTKRKTSHTQSEEICRRRLHPCRASRPQQILRHHRSRPAPEPLETNHQRWTRHKAHQEISQKRHHGKRRHREEQSKGTHKAAPSHHCWQISISTNLTKNGQSAE